MSEFALEHAADRLTGAPPGFVGYQSGGELTGAVRRQPFRVVLFDEIEKAHPLVMDKFLQILEDGRLTDGQGVTTYFSECVLIFTSNLGVVEVDPDTNERKLRVSPTEPYAVLEKKVQDAITAHFTVKIGRPELRNRFGDNIIVFGFISEETARDIFDLQFRHVQEQVRRELGIELTLSDPVRDQLRHRCTADPLNGGRGIGNQLETYLINPLSRLLFDNDTPPDSAVHVTALHEDTAQISLDIETSKVVAV
jgi:ATP-dependent Clp protease ATP-binding subunit ClpA